MTRALEVGTSVMVEVPATSANLGPGFDCFGLALDWRDTFTCSVTEDGFRAEVSGVGADRLARDESHLVISSIRYGLAALGCSVPGLRLVAANTIPHGRGLGSSAAAIVGGLLAAQALTGTTGDEEWLITTAADLEGHPDNVAAAALGGFTMAYAGAAAVRTVRGRVAHDLGALLFVPELAVSTAVARSLLPPSIPHADAAANAGRAALFVHAIGGELTLLPAATEDWLHTSYRKSAMPQSYALLTDLRHAGLAAVISGAGPSVLVLGSTADLVDVAAWRAPAFTAFVLGVGRGAEAHLDSVAARKRPLGS